MNLQPHLENELVVVRPLMESDFDDLFQVAVDKILWEQHWTTDRWTPEGFKKFFEDSMKSKSAVVVIEQKTKKIIGSSRYYISETAPEAVEIGWSFLARAYWGGVYNRSFKSLMIEHGLRSKKDVLFLIATDNVRSQMATEKLGAKKVDRTKEPHLFRKEKTHFTYRINTEMWTIQSRKK